MSQLESQSRALSIVISVLLFAACALLLLVGLSLPIIEPIHLVTFQSKSTNPTSTSNVTQLSFGLWGFCAYSELRKNSILNDGGYCIGPQSKYTIPSDIAAQLGISDNLLTVVADSLLAVLILHPIATALSLIASITSLFVASHAVSLTLAVVAGLTGTAVYVVYIVLGLMAREEVGTLQGFNMEFGNGIWMVLAGIIFIWTAVVLLSTRACPVRAPKPLLNILSGSWRILKYPLSIILRVLKYPLKICARTLKLFLSGCGITPNKAKPFQWTCLIRCTLFIVMEGVFIGVACVLRKHPISLSHPISDSFASSSIIRSAFGTLFMLWHTIACAIGSGILYEAYSREWKPREEEARQRQSKDWEQVDSVSTVTSGWIERIPHFLGWNPTRPSLTFMLAFVASILMLTLLHVGSSTIVVINGTAKWPVDVGGLILGTSQKAHSILNVEHVLGLGLGFGTQPNWIIPKPASNPLGGSMEYTSDLVYFHHSCQWLVPQFSDVSPAVGHVIIGNESFYFTQFKTPPNSTLLDTTTFGSAVYSLLPDSSSSISAFVIFGGNSTFPLDSDPFSGNATTPLSVVGVRATGNTIDLSGLPTVYNASWFNVSGDRFKASDGRSLVFRAPLATALYCNASATLNTGRVRLASGNLTVQVASPLFPRVHNIDEDNIPQYFSWALDGVGNSLDSYVWALDSAFTQSHLLVDVTALAQRLLLPSDMTGFSLFNTSIPPLSLDDIGANMDALVLSASKAQQVDGIEGVVGRDMPSGSRIMQVIAEGPGQQQVLATSLPWLLLTAIDTLLTFTLCLWITFLIPGNDHVDSDNRPRFTLSEVRTGYIPQA